MNATHPAEQWRPIAGYEDRYEVSNHGRVRSLDWWIYRDDTPNPIRHHGRMLKPGVNSHGYHLVTLSRGGKRDQRRVHRLVAEAFIGPPPPGLVVRHLDDMPSNNRVGNLAYGTVHENSIDAVENGRNAQLQKTHCPAGHEYSEENTHIEERNGRPLRRCLTCRRLTQRNVNHGSVVPMSQCEDCGKRLAHRRGGQCRDCWKSSMITKREATRERRRRSA